jgi:hypothetical protein
VQPPCIETLRPGAERRDVEKSGPSVDDREIRRPQSGDPFLKVAVAIASGAAAHSLSLIAFGVDSLIELASAGVLLWRLDIEIRRGAEFPKTVEQRASRIGGALLFVLAAYVVVSAAYGLWMREG